MLTDLLAHLTLGLKVGRVKLNILNEWKFWSKIFGKLVTHVNHCKIENKMLGKLGDVRKIHKLVKLGSELWNYILE